MVLCAAFSASSSEAPSAILLAAQVPSTIGPNLTRHFVATLYSRLAMASAAFCAE